MEKRITAKEIIREIGRNMREGLEPLEYTTLAPNHYDVYLAAEDYKELDPIFKEIREEARKKLDEELRDLNEQGQTRPGPLRRLWVKAPDHPAAYERKGSAWEIEFFVDHEPDAAPGNLTIHSYFTTARQADYGVGSRTKRVVTRLAGDRTEVVQVTLEPGPLPAPAKPAGGVLARIRYTDERGEQVYEMTKESIVIGRRDEEGKGYWADLRLETRPDVSREHARLRRDEATGRFLIKDLSKFGTAVNGSAIPTSIEVENGEKRDRDVWVPLPERAEIDLAGVITLSFEAL